MLQGYNGLRGWVILAAVVPLAFFVTYFLENDVRRAAFWGDDWRDMPLEARIQVLPDDAVASLRDELSDRRNASKVGPAEAADYVVKDLQAAVARYPESVKRLVADHLIGVFLVQGLGGSANSHNVGMAIEVIGLWHQHVGTVILIDRDETDVRANMAMAGMEYVPARDFRGVNVESRLARRDQNDRATTLSYVLLHELGHLIDYDRGITPDHFDYGATRDGCGFTCISWTRTGRHRYSDRIDQAMQSIRTGQFDRYVGALPETFQHLADSDFPSLYASTMPAEDFAESFAQYVHTVVLGRPWEMILRVDGTIRGRLTSCYVDGRCPRKRAYFDALLGDGR